VPAGPARIPQAITNALLALLVTVVALLLEYVIIARWAKRWLSDDELNREMVGLLQEQLGEQRRLARIQAVQLQILESSEGNEELHREQTVLLEEQLRTLDGIFMQLQRLAPAETDPADKDSEGIE
jgi:hypothetical protein